MLGDDGKGLLFKPESFSYMVFKCIKSTEKNISQCKYTNAQEENVI